MATAKLFNLARMTTATTGTGTMTLGSAVAGYLSFADAGVANADTVTYAIKDGANAEIGRGVYTTSGTTLTRATILASTNGGSAINLSGTAEVFITASAQDFVGLDTAGFVPEATFANTGLHILDTNASHDLIVKPGSDLTADRTLTVTTGDADRTLDISAGSVTISAAGAALIDDANAAAQRSTLGLAIGTDVQAYDADLTTLATNITAFGHSLVDDANAAAARTTLGLAIGTDVQAYHVRLADIAGASWAQGDIAYFDGTNLARLAAGTNGRFLRTQGAGANPIWADLAPGGSSGELQYNNSGAFGGMAGTSWDDTNRSLTITGATVTTSNPILNLTQTWNAGGVTFTADKQNITDTASAAGSLLIDRQIGGTSRFQVQKNGNVKAIGSSGGITLGAGDSNVTTVLQASSGLRVLNSTSTAWVKVTTGGLGIQDTASLDWGSFGGESADLKLFRDAANIFAQRNGTNVQSFRIYSTFTDTSNYERGALNAGADYIELAAETAGTGDDNLDIRLTPAGTGKVRFGSHSAIGAETVTGYVTIKDSGGTDRKIAVVS